MIFSRVLKEDFKDSFKIEKEEYDQNSYAVRLFFYREIDSDRPLIETRKAKQSEEFALTKYNQ